MNVLDILTLLAYVALNMDIVFQILRVLKTKSSHDLSLIGLFIRFMAILVLLFKFITLIDMPLIIGQGLLTFTFGIYLFLGFYYVKRRRR